MAGTVSPITSEQFTNYYNQWKAAQDYAAKNASKLTPIAGTTTTALDSLVRQINPYDPTSGYEAVKPMIGSATPEAIAYAQYKSQMAQGSQPVTEFAGYLEKQGVGQSSAILKDLAAGNIGKYQSYIPQFNDWRAADQQRANASGMLSGTIGSLIPTVMGALTGNPFLGAVVGATQQGISSGGGLLDMLGGALGGASGALGAQKYLGYSNGPLLGSGASNAVTGASAANAVPGGSTGITTPTGGGLVGSGQLNPAGVGILGNTASSGIPLIYSPLASGGIAPVSTPSLNPANVVQGTNPSASPLSSLAQSAVKNVAINAIEGLLAPPETGGGLLPSAPSTSGRKSGAYTASPYPELLRRARRGISNQLV